jgi:hypothetical protein
MHFLSRIQREKRQLEIKNKILERGEFSEVFTDDNTIDTSPTIRIIILSKMQSTINLDTNASSNYYRHSLWLS